MKKIYLIDWNSFIYRMFFALPEFATKDWKIVNALFWMAKFFVSSLVKQNPDYIVFVKDAKWENFRHKLYADYKATRDRMPDNLRTQIWDIEKMISKMWIEIVEISWFEADDVIWTLAVNLWQDNKNDIYILSWDKDLYSLVTDNVSIYDTMKRKIYNPEKTKEKFWIEPKLIIDYLAIVWDKADNIPWIDWFWPKKAVDLINNLWTVENILKEIDLVNSWEKKYSDYDKSIQWCFKWKTFEKLLNSKDEAILSKKLATVDLNMDLWDFNLENFEFKPDTLLNEEVVKFFQDHEFNSLLWENEIQKSTSWDDLSLKIHNIFSKEHLDKLFDTLKNRDYIILDTETTSLDVIEAQLVWISIYIDDDKIYYINRLHEWQRVLDSELKEFLNNLFDLNTTIVWHNIKYDLEIIDLFLSSKNISLSGYSNWQISLNL